jgi:hypothetical protein
MSQRDLLIAMRSVSIGLLTLLAAMLLIEQPLLRLAGPILGANWLPTAQLALECAGFFAVGWVIGRWGRLSVLLFAGIISIPNFRGLPGMDVPWLFHLLLDCFQNTRYLEPFVTSLATHILLFASLFVGAHLSRAREQAVLHIK